jgi:hypothetical protein
LYGFHKIAAYQLKKESSPGPGIVEIEEQVEEHQRNADNIHGDHCQIRFEEAVTEPKGATE